MFTADLYKERYGAKYLGWPVVKFLYTRTKVLKVIRCLIGSQCSEEKGSSKLHAWIGWFKSIPKV